MLVYFMKKILITGKADKRIVSYPFLNLCNYAGKTCLVTDDVNYKRLYEGYEKTGEIDNISISIISPVDRQDSLEDLFLQKDEEGYDILVLVLDSYMNKDVDYTFLVANQLKTFLGAEIEEVIEELTNVTAIVTSLMKQPIPKGTISYNWAPEDLAYLYSVEENRKLFSPKNKKLVQCLKPGICNALGITEATYETLSGKGGKK